MATALADVISAAKFAADMQNSDRVLQGEWVLLLRAAIKSTWNIAGAAAPDFAVTFLDFTLTSSASASQAVPRDFHSLIDVVFAPDTPNEYSLGPFAWQNRRSSIGWWPAALFPGFIGSGPTRSRLMGSLVYVEPSLQAGGNYRMWYSPVAHTPDIIVRLATSGALPACTAAGSGVGKTLTGNAVGVLVVDGQSTVLNDIILVKNQASSGDNGVYVVTTEGTAGVAFVLTRSTSFDTTAEISVADIIAVGQTNPVLAAGAVNEAKFFQVATFTAIEAAMTFTEGANLESILDQFEEIVRLKTAVQAMNRDGGSTTTSVADYNKKLDDSQGNGLIPEMRKYFALQRQIGVSKTIDTDMIGSRGWGGW